MKRLFLLCSFPATMLYTSKLSAAIRLPPIVSSNMVLQQNSEATL